VVWAFVHAENLTHKKRPCWPASRTARMSHGDGSNG
jgi:hypothetical protein